MDGRWRGIWSSSGDEALAVRGGKGNLDKQQELIALEGTRLAGGMIGGPRAFSKYADLEVGYGGRARTTFDSRDSKNHWTNKKGVLDASCLERS